MKERWFNYRPLIFVFLFLLLGSLFAFYIIREMLVTIVISIIVLGILIATAIIKRKIKLVLIPIISFILGLSIYLLAILPFKDTNYVDNPPTNISARVFYKSKPIDGRITVYADSCILGDEKENFNIIIYIYDNDNLFENIEIGSKLTFKVQSIYHNELTSGEIPNTNYFAKDLRYSVTCDIDELFVTGNDKTFAENIKNKIYNNLSNGLSNENRELAYSSLFGDKATLADAQKDTFKLSGVAHLLAVSGLHVGIISGILFALLKPLKKKGIKFALISLVLFFYMYICNFSVSVVRASIMTIVMLLAKMCFRRYDTMSAIGLAGIICFIVNPLSVFDISFLMSFSCVIGIVMLYRPIQHALMHTKAPKWLVDSISVSTATMVALTFIMAYFFKNLNIISILANIIIIPIFTICFSIFFVLSFVSLILPFVTFILHIINPILNLITLIANILGNLPIANFGTMSINYHAILCYFLFLVLIGRMCVAKREKKFITALPIIALLVVGIML